MMMVPRSLDCFLLIGLLAVAGGSVQAAGNDDPSGKDLKEVERALEKGQKQQETLEQKSKTLTRDLEYIRSRTVQVAAAVQDHESAVLDLEDKLVDLERTEKEKLDQMAAQREQFGNVLMALQRMARHPPEAMIAAPVSPSDTVRGAILLRAAVPAIEDQATTLRQDLSALLYARRRATEKRQQLASARAGLDIERQRLEGLLVEKTQLKEKTDQASKKAAQRVQELVKKAKSLRDLMSRLDADRKKREETEAKSPVRKNVRALPKAPITKAKGRMPYPVIGRLVGRYGQALETGLTRKGITIETGVGAQVVAPHQGTVVFAGAFKGYGQLLIIEHGEGYHSLLAGLDRIYNEIGQQVFSGEPAGVMGRPEKGLPVLYVELRRNGQPINPLPWLAARKIKVNG